MKNILIVTLVIITGILGFSLYNIYEKNKVLEKEINSTKKENLDKTSPELVKFIDDNEIRRFLAIKKYPTNYIFTNAMFENDLLLWVLDKTCPEFGECKTIKTKDLDKIFKKTFNLENLAYVDYVCPADEDILYKYDKENKEYDLITTNDKDILLHDHDNIYTYFEPIYTKTDSITNRGKDYILTLYELYYDLKEGKFISDTMNKNIQIFNPEDYLNKETDEVDINKITEDYENTFENNKDTYTKHIYTFRKNNDNEFYLYKYELEKP